MKKVSVTEIIQCPYCNNLFCAKTGEKIILETRKK